MRIIVILISLLLSACVGIDGYQVLGFKEKKKKKHRSYKRSLSHKVKPAKSPAPSPGITIYDSTEEQPIQTRKPGDKPEEP
jgi:hypothetical protein